MNDGLLKSTTILEKKRDDINTKLEKSFQIINEKKRFAYVVSDHAVLRYLQRVELIPVSEARYKILTMVEDFLTDKKVELLKDTNYKLNIKGITFIIRNRTIITTEVKSE